VDKFYSHLEPHFHGRVVNPRCRPQTSGGEVGRERYLNEAQNLLPLVRLFGKRLEIPKNGDLIG
jgi:hypothetical protein